MNEFGCLRLETVLKPHLKTTENSIILPLGNGNGEASRIETAVKRHMRAFKAGSSLLFEGDESNAMFYVKSGWITLSKSLENGQTQIIDFALPGDVVDPTSADGVTVPFNVEALTDAVIAVVPFQDWEAILRDDPDLRRVAHTLDAAEQARRAERMLRLGKGTAEMRVAYALLEFCVRLGSACQSDDPTFHIPITQQQLGDFIGLSSVHVCRTMRRMARNNVVEMTDHMDIHVIDSSTLVELAGVDADVLEREIVP